jgi:hypothetical protein
MVKRYGLVLIDDPSSDARLEPVEAQIRLTLQLPVNGHRRRLRRAWWSLREHHQSALVRVAAIVPRNSLLTSGRSKHRRGEKNESPHPTECRRRLLTSPRQAAAGPGTTAKVRGIELSALLALFTQRRKETV